MGKKQWNDNVLAPWDKFLHEVYRESMTKFQNDCPDLRVKHLAVEVRRGFSLTSPEGTPGSEVNDNAGDCLNKEGNPDPEMENIADKHPSTKQKEENIRRNTQLLEEIMGNELLEEVDELEKDEQERKKNKRKRGKNTTEGGPPKRANRK